MLASLLFALALPDAAPAGEKQATEVRQYLESVDRPSSERRERATAFAESVAEVIDLIRDHAVFEVTPERLARLAVEALFQRHPGRMSADLRRRLYAAGLLTAEQLREILRDAYLQARPDSEPESVRNKVILRMLRAVDPHADWTQRFCIFQSLSPLYGVGLRLQPDPASGMVRVLTSVRNSPAHVAGIRTGDVLTAVTLSEDSAGHPLPDPEVVSTRGLSVAEVGAKILGRKDTRVGLSLRRGNGPVRTVRVRRDAVVLESVIGWRLKGDDRWDFWLDAERRIAYVRLTSFRHDTVRDLQRVLDRLQKEGMRGLVLDLRFNPGGLLDAAVQIADLFVDDGILFRIWPRNDRECRFDGKREGSRLDFPLACLINGESKRSAETVAACLQDHRRAVLVGERSQGEASLQNIMPVEKSEGYELQLTTAVFLRPSGRKLDRIRLQGHAADEWGVTPDEGQAVVLMAPERGQLKDYLDSRDWLLRRDQPDALRHFRDRQRDQALAYLRGRSADDSGKPRQ